MKKGKIKIKNGKFHVLLGLVDLGMLGMAPNWSKGFDTEEEAKKYGLKN
jgi:hypothetical protein|tara:strand:+ start:521 stop:667 length:147 start_codon:yes stop_codon:yes gene_type:complete